MLMDQTWKLCFPSNQHFQPGCHKIGRATVAAAANIGSGLGIKKDWFKGTSTGNLGNHWFFNGIWKFPSILPASYTNPLMVGFKQPPRQSQKAWPHRCWNVQATSAQNIHTHTLCIIVPFWQFEFCGSNSGKHVLPNPQQTWQYLPPGINFVV